VEQDEPVCEMVTERRCNNVNGTTLQLTLSFRSLPTIAISRHQSGSGLTFLIFEISFLSSVAYELATSALTFFRGYM